MQLSVLEKINQLPYGVVTLSEDQKKVKSIDEKPYLNNNINEVYSILI